MANYVSNHIYIAGSKQAIVDFLNKGLKNDKVKKRVSIYMSGEEIVALINGMERPLSMGSYFPCPKTFDTYDTTNGMKSFFRWWEATLEKKEIELEIGVRIDYPNGEMEKLQEFIKTHKAEIPDIDQETALRMMYPNFYRMYRKYVKGYCQAKYYQKKKYGVVGWYDWNKANYGCKWDCAFGVWKCEKDKDDTLCFSVSISTPWSPAYKFVENLNKFDGITVYAYAWGDMNWPFFFWYNGRKNEGDAIEPKDDERYEQCKKEIDAIKEQKIAEAQDEEARNKAEEEWDTAMINLDDEMLDEKWQQFKKEMNAEIGLELKPITPVEPQEDESPF